MILSDVSAKNVLSERLTGSRYIKAQASEFLHTSRGRDWRPAGLNEIARRVALSLRMDTIFKRGNTRGHRLGKFLNLSAAVQIFRR